MLYLLLTFFLLRYTYILWHPVWGHVRVHIFNRPISDESIKLLGITTKYFLRAGVCNGESVKSGEFFFLLWYVDSRLHQFNLITVNYFWALTVQSLKWAFIEIKKTKFSRTRNINAILFCIKHNCNMKIQFCTVKRV